MNKTRMSEIKDKFADIREGVRRNHTLSEI